MKVVIIGAGALGSVIGAHLARAGEEVVLLARGRRAALVRQRGVTLTGLADFTAPVPVVEDARTITDADVLLVAVKSYDTEAALESVAHLPVKSALSLQNGVVKDEQLARRFGWERTLGATAAVSAEVTPEGPVRLTLNEGLYLGELPEGSSSRVATLAATLTRAGIPGTVSPRIRTLEWSKYVFFAGAMAVASLTRLETYRFLMDPDLAYLQITIAREVAQIATRLGIPLVDHGAVRAKTLTTLPVGEAVAHAQRSGEALEARGATRHKVSTLQDLERGRRMEIEEILGYALRKGAELGLCLPTVAICYRLLSGIDRALR